MLPELKLPDWRTEYAKWQSGLAPFREGFDAELDIKGFCVSWTPLQSQCGVERDAGFGFFWYGDYARKDNPTKDDIWVCYDLDMRQYHIDASCAVLWTLERMMREPNAVEQEITNAKNGIWSFRK